MRLGNEKNQQAVFCIALDFHYLCMIENHVITPTFFNTMTRKLISTTLFLPWLLLCLVSCGDDYTLDTNGVTIKVQQEKPGDARMVRLQVVGEKIIRVSATPNDGFADAASLVVLPQQEVPEFTVSQDDDTVTVSTTSLNASVAVTTGEVWFTDTDGHVLLREQDGGGKNFTPIEAGGTHGYTVRQVFESPDDEAFYGLGQHQSDEFNYKGKSEELYQYNTKVSIPFVVSNKRYGLLLDSYSQCRFGSPEGFKQLGQVFNLYDKQGHEGALTGTYVAADTVAVATLERREDSICFDHLMRHDLTRVEGLPVGFPMNGAKVTYEGEIEPTESGEYNFKLYYAGYATVYVDGKVVVPTRWRTAWNPNGYKFSATLQGGRRVPVRIEWQPDGEVSYCALQALPPATAEERGRQSWWSEMSKQLDYYFIAGDDIDEVISGYRTLTGKSPIMPKWAMGYWQSRERYKTQDELLATFKEFRDRQIPIDNIVLDWLHWPEVEWGSHRFDPDRFPDPQAMVDSIHAMNGRLMVSIWPKFYTNTEHFKQFDRNGWIFPLSVADSLRDWVGPGYTYGFYDAYSADARRLFWKQIEESYYPLGIDAWWMDASEPNIRDCTDMQYRKDLCGPTAMGSSTEYFNAYALMNASAIYEGQRSAAPDRRVFQLTRSGFAGQQRYAAATWSGDIAARWEDLKAQISAGLNFSICGIPYWTMDIGGFCVENRYVAAQAEWEKTHKEGNADLAEWRELNTRWFQFGAFCPLFRSHGQYPFREPWAIAQDDSATYKSMVYYTQLRYRLMPYIYTLAGMTWHDDYTIMRPLVMDFTTDSVVNDIGDQFMLGPAIMVSPVYEYGARSRQVYLPKCAGWYDFYTGQYIEPGQTIDAPAPYEHIPLHVKAGSIVAAGPAIQHTGTAASTDDNTIRLYVYVGADAHFNLYEDDGTSYDYERRHYSVIPITYNDASKTLTIGDREGSYDGMLRDRNFIVVPVSRNHPRPFDPDADGAVIKYTGRAVTVKAM